MIVHDIQNGKADLLHSIFLITFLCPSVINNRKIMENNFHNEMEIEKSKTMSLGFYGFVSCMYVCMLTNGL